MTKYFVRIVLIAASMVGGMPTLQAVTSGLLVNPIAFEGFLDSERQTLMLGWQQLQSSVTEMLSQDANMKVLFIATPQKKATVMLQSHLLRIQVPAYALSRFYYYWRVSDIVTGEVYRQHLETVADINNWTTLLTRDIQTVLSQDVIAKDLLKYKKIEIDSVHNTRRFGPLDILARWQLAMALQDQVIIIDRQGHYAGQHFLSLNGQRTPATASGKTLYYRVQDYIQLRIQTDIMRTGSPLLAVAAAQTTLFTGVSNAVNGQLIQQFETPWMQWQFSVQDANGNWTATAEAEDAWRISGTIGKQIATRLLESTDVISEWNKNVVIADRQGRWAYLNAGRKRGLRMGDRLIATTDSGAVGLHVIRFFGPGRMLLCPQTGRVINDGAIAFIRGDASTLKAGDAVADDPQLYPVLPKNIKR